MSERRAAISSGLKTTVRKAISVSIPAEDYNLLLANVPVISDWLREKIEPDLKKFRRKRRK